MQGAFLHTAGVLENLLTRLLYVIFQLLFLLITDVLRHDTFDQSSGGDDHPSANQFLFMYRILPVSSLIKSPKRASVQTEPSRILLSMQSAPTSRTSGMAAIHSRLLEKLCPSEINILPSADFVGVMFAHCSDSAANEDDLDMQSTVGCLRNVNRQSRHGLYR
jgi:Na+/serine symporter